MTHGIRECSCDDFAIFISLANYDQKLIEKYLTKTKKNNVRLLINQILFC